MNHRTNRTRRLDFAAALLCHALPCALLASCTGSEIRQGSGTVTPATAAPYRIQPGDELEIRFFHTPDIDVLLPVRPDGYISLPLVHELKAAGRTADDLRLDLVERYRGELADPEVVVIVRKFSHYAVHVGGEVAKPGVLALDGARNVLEAVFAAGGFLPTADLSEVLVVRRGEPAGYELLHSDLDALLDGSDTSGNLVLRPFDVVFVPASPIAEVNKWVDQYLRKNIPVTFTYRLDDGD